MKNYSSSKSNRDKGFVIILVVIVQVLGIAGALLMTNYINSYIKQSLRSTHDDSFDFALNSVLDYTIGALKNRWCFTSTLTSDQSTPCDLVHPMNTERLLITDEQLHSIAVLYQNNTAVYGGNIDLVRLKALPQASFSLSNLTSTHPLFFIATLLKKFNEDMTFTIDIERLDSNVSRGNDVLLEIKATLTFGTNLTAKLNRAFMTARSQIRMSPRELNTNSLIIAGDLFLDRPDPGLTASTFGATYIQPDSTFSVGSMPGIKFESPVFVNGDIHVPSTGNYTPVTFTDKVILGGGFLRTLNNGTDILMTPATGGDGNDRYYSQSLYFGGFLGGIELDPKRDDGLDVFSGATSPTAGTSNAVICKKREAAKVDLSITRDSQLYVSVGTAVEGPSSGTWNLSFNLGRLDQFVPVGPAPSAGPLFTAEIGNNPPSFLVTHQDPNSPAIGRLLVSISGWKQTTTTTNHQVQLYVDMTSRSTLTIYMDQWGVGLSSIQIDTFQGVLNGNPQTNRVDMTVSFLNQSFFNVANYTPYSGGGTLAPTISPSIDIRLAAFDVAYKYDKENNSIKSFRTLGIPAGFYPDGTKDPVNCPTTSFGYTNDTMTLTTYQGSTTFHCWSQFHWHPILEKWKNNGVTIGFDNTNQNYVLKSVDRDLNKPYTNVYYSCGSLDSGGPTGAYQLNSNCPVYDPNQVPDTTDWYTFDLGCYSSASAVNYYPASNPADWSTSFVTDTRTSWGFTEVVKTSSPATDPPPGYNPGTLVFDNNNSRLDILNGIKPTFGMASIFNTCQIKSTANFVVGFYVCDNLVIDPRVLSDGPLRIVGTFIVGKATIDPSVAQVGLRWSSIWGQTVERELRTAKVLHTIDDSTNPEICDALSNPSWMPFVSSQAEDNQKKCSSVYLRRKARPFTWTTVDPDCGIVGQNVQCKNHPTRFEAHEMRRVFE